MKICDEKLCTGCMTCYNICPNGSISFSPDAEGFLVPIINEDTCIKCGLCAKNCPQNNKPNYVEYEKKVYACWLKDKKKRKSSTSGGACTALAETIIGKGGVVFGAAYNNEMQVTHQKILSVDEISKIRGSKYVQSYIGNTYAEVKKCLEAGKKVLFSGTPCQVDGLYSYLGSRYPEQLYTIDLICHGVPSPMIYNDYLQYMQKKENAKVTNVIFRNKRPGWYIYGMKVLFDNGHVYRKNKYADPYLRAFLQDYICRPTCHSCRYANINRCGDITLADFWGYTSQSEKYIDNDKGISMCIINTKSGNDLFEASQGELIYILKSLESAERGNKTLKGSFPPNIRRKDFWEDYYKYGFENIIEKYLNRQTISKSDVKRILLMKVPLPVRKLVKKLRNSLK